MSRWFSGRANALNNSAEVVAIYTGEMHSRDHGSKNRRPVGKYRPTAAHTCCGVNLQPTRVRASECQSSRCVGGFSCHVEARIRRQITTTVQIRSLEVAALPYYCLYSGNISWIYPRIPPTITNLYLRAWTLLKRALMKAFGWTHFDGINSDEYKIKASKNCVNKQ